MKTRCPAAPLGLVLFGLLLLDGSVLFQTYAVDVEVKDASNITCLYAKWMMNISITYESESNGFKKTAFTLPEQLTYDGSSCGNDTKGPVLAIEFGKDHSWVISFTKTADTYQGSISFTYNTNDTELFPDAKKKGLITISANYPERPVQLNTVFSCNDVDFIEDDNVRQDFWNVSLQVFLEDGFRSSNKTLCDQVTVPTATVPTTTVPSTTTEPNDTTSSPSPTLPPEENPATGKYSVVNGTAACLLATMALQLNISQKEPLIINFNPNTTSARGSCGATSAVLELKDKNNRVVFVFAARAQNAERYYLREVNITVAESTNETLFAGNRSLNYWDTSRGSSYMCRREETLVVAPGYKINIFDLKIQPFDVEDGQFSTAQECLMDDDSILIPIVVGAALTGLIGIIVLAYLIGRRKSDVGYQTL
ncbi:lysosome-associated membrane glycoprotein 2 isoform X2 [Elgaria multicarinata webbii]|uniref:lysosome-associated membrane glycoprotein 2 isoform X2 n=1 Tax=Elgaria multicarinata webbii TaxID=159646 RepID=UPI002FCCFC45